MIMKAGQAEKKLEDESRKRFGYEDPELVRRPNKNISTWISVLAAIIFIASVWLALDAKLLFGKDWLSPTYDNPDWRTNEGNLHTFGAWDLEAHIWKTEYIMQNFPNFHWNPYWYMGMPLLKYYQIGFYFVHWLTIVLTGTSPARAAILLIIFSHLLATLLTFVLCYKVSGRIWISAFSATFLLSNTFVSLRSYGWEPITVVFLFLYPLGLLMFLKEPLRPFRFWMILILGIAYLTHPLLWFSLLMTMGIYLVTVALRQPGPRVRYHSMLSYFGAGIASVLIGAVQFLPQMSYQQVTSGAHMGVKYLPYYQVPYNIISLKDFLFDAGNLKGPGPIVMIALFLIILFGVFLQRHRFIKHPVVSGFSLVLFLMVFFYYIELYDLFPMNVLRSIQYHRIIPEFIIAAAVVVAAMYNLIRTSKQRILYYAMVISFTFASFIVIYFVQLRWETVSTISDTQEFITAPVGGRISFPYTDQSLSVRNSFTDIPQVYGYYEQGITNPYDDELFSVSSGFHDVNLTMIYLKAADVSRLYVNMEEGMRDYIVRARLNETMNFTYGGGRYGYFTVPLSNPSLAQAVPASGAEYIRNIGPGCRVIFTDNYCGSNKEEFVGTDQAEVKYLLQYDRLLDQPYSPKADMRMANPDNYLIHVTGATADTAIVVKMTYDSDFAAVVDGKQVPIEMIGPGFMLIKPGLQGNYSILLQYRISRLVIAGAGISIISIIGFAIFFAIEKRLGLQSLFRFKKGDL